MAKKLTYHFYLKDKNSLKPTPINLAINVSGLRKKYGIGESILPEWWDEVNEQAIEDNRQKKTEKVLAKRVNRNLKRIRSELDPLFDDYNGVDKMTPNHSDGDDMLLGLLEQVANIITGQIETESKEEKAARITPSQFFDEFVETWSHTANERTGIVPSKGTVWNYKNTIRRYKDFIADSNIKDSFSIFDKDFQAMFDEYLLEEQELSMNTITASHSQLKTMLDKAVESKLLHDLSYRKWPTKTITLTKVYLDDAELNSIYNLTLTPQLRKDNKIGSESHIEESRDLFIISSRTGLRYSDLKHLNAARWIMTEGRESLSILVQKTSGRVYIPLHKQVIEIYKKYNGKLPVVIDKSKYNKHISTCARLAGITSPVESFTWEKGHPAFEVKEKYKYVTSHTGRRSFATNLYLATGKAAPVMAITGHKTEENFRRYLCVDQEELAEMARKYINLDKNVKDPELDAFVQRLENAVLSKERYRKEIRDLESQLELTNILSDEKQKGLESRIRDLQLAMTLGLTMEQFLEYQKHADVISSIVDASDPFS